MVKIHHNRDLPVSSLLCYHRQLSEHKRIMQTRIVSVRPAYGRDPRRKFPHLERNPKREMAEQLKKKEIKRENDRIKERVAFTAAKKTARIPSPPHIRNSKGDERVRKLKNNALQAENKVGF